MKHRNRQFLYGFIHCFLRTTAPVQDAGPVKSIVHWYRTAGIRIIQSALPLFGNYVMVSLTTRCQCSCPHCGVGPQQSSGTPELAESEINTLIDEAHTLGAYAMYFFGGEPLLVPELPGYIVRARTRGLRTRLDTNGILLDEEMVIRLKKAGLDEIGVSIDSLNGAVHDTGRGVAGALRKALAGISLCKKHELSCYISTIATRDSLHKGDLSDIIALAREQKARVRILSPIRCGRWESREDIRLSSDDILLLRGVLERGFVFWDSEFIDTKDAPFLCAAKARRSLYVSAHCDVQPCCYIPISFGNIRKEPLPGILKRMRRSDILDNRDHGFDCPTNSGCFQQGLQATPKKGIHEWKKAVHL
jgi:MoaA/NifB/PqqE/SkfB family radical SAM enzyme